MNGDIYANYLNYDLEISPSDLHDEKNTKHAKAKVQDICVSILTLTEKKMTDHQLYPMFTVKVTNKNKIKVDVSPKFKGKYIVLPYSAMVAFDDDPIMENIMMYDSLLPLIQKWGDAVPRDKEFCWGGGGVTPLKIKAN